MKITFVAVISLAGMMVVGASFAMERNSPRFGQTSKNNSQDVTALLLNKLEDLQRQLQQLRGELEMQSHNLNLLQQQQADFIDFQKKYEERLQQVDVDNDSLSMTSQQQLDSSPQDQASKASSDGRRNGTMPVSQLESLNLDVSNLLLGPADEKSYYDEAYQLVQQRQFRQAIVAMQQYLTSFPNGTYTANAIYWLGELYLADGEPEQALDQFNTIINKYPDSNKVGPSMLKIGFAYQTLGDLNNANQQLRKVQRQFPGSSVAQLATVHLQDMAQETASS